MTPNQYLWTQARDRLVAAVAGIGFSAELAELMARQLKSPKAIDRMVSYIRQAHPRTEIGRATRLNSSHPTTSRMPSSA